MTSRSVLIVALIAMPAFLCGSSARSVASQTVRSQSVSSGGASSGRLVSLKNGLTAQQGVSIQRYFDEMNRASVADVCANRRKFHARLRGVLTPQQLVMLKSWDATNRGSGTPRREQLVAAQKAARSHESVYNAFVASEAACKDTGASCAAAAHAVSLAADALQSALLEELVTTARHCE